MSPEKRIYKPVREYSVQEVEEAIINADLDILRTAAFAVPWHWKDWQAAQKLCAHLSNYQDEVVRGNALLGLHYLARFQRHLDKKLAETILLRGLKDPSPSVRERAQDAIEDVNYLMKWKIGKKK